MGARQKLNGAFVNGCVILGVIVGSVCESVLLGLLAGVAAVALAINSGEIRLKPRDRK